MLRAVNPATETMAREQQADNLETMHHKLATAKDAHFKWRKKTIEERAAFLKRTASKLREEKEQYAALMTEEMGKPKREALGEVEKCAVTCEHYAAHAAEYLAEEEIRSDATRSWVQYVPLGTVLGILPWNAPFWLAFRVAAPALMAGNVVVIKGDPHVPGCTAALTALFEKAGFDAGVFSALFLENQHIEAAIRHPLVHAVSFTGSTQAGRKVAAAAGEELKPTVLELGGSDPSIVLADADLDQAAEIIAFSRIINAGQSCIAVKRVLVEQSVYEPFLEKFREQLARYEMGDPTDIETAIGPLARKDLRDNLHQQVEATVDAGARCLLGGQVPERQGFYYPVTLLADVKPEMVAFQEETFGPVAAVTAIKDLEEGITLANQTHYGLAASIWTTAERGIALTRELEAGQIVVNGLVKTDPRLPSGGIKCSGYGRELGGHGIREFVNAQQVWVGPKR